MARETGPAPSCAPKVSSPEPEPSEATTRGADRQAGAAELRSGGLTAPANNFRDKGNDHEHDDQGEQMSACQVCGTGSAHVTHSAYDLGLQIRSCGSDQCVDRVHFRFAAADRTTARPTKHRAIWRESTPTQETTPTFIRGNSSALRAKTRPKPAAPPRRTRGHDDYIKLDPWALRAPIVTVENEVRDCFEMLEDDEGREKGAWLYGRATATGVELMMRDRVQTGEWSHMQMEDREEVVDMATRRRCSLAGLVHSHPTGRLRFKPSATDLECWRANAEGLGHAFAGIIVAPRDCAYDKWDWNPWLSPSVSCFVAQPNGDVYEARFRHDWQPVAA